MSTILSLRSVWLAFFWFVKYYSLVISHCGVKPFSTISCTIVHISILWTIILIYNNSSGTWYSVLCLLRWQKSFQRWRIKFSTVFFVRWYLDNHDIVGTNVCDVSHKYQGHEFHFECISIWLILTWVISLKAIDTSNTIQYNSNPICLFSRKYFEWQWKIHRQTQKSERKEKKGNEMYRKATLKLYVQMFKPQSLW